MPSDFGAAEAVRSAVLGFGFFAFEGIDPLGMPDEQEANQACHRNHRRTDIGQPRAMQIRDQNFGYREADTSHQNGWPDFQH